VEQDCHFPCSIVEQPNKISWWSVAFPLIGKFIYICFSKICIVLHFPNETLFHKLIFYPLKCCPSGKLFIFCSRKCKCTPSASF